MTSTKKNSKKLTIKHVGYGPSGTAAYVVLNAKGDYVWSNGQFLLTSSQADALVAAKS